jgi:Uma2 family endonuclease
VKRAIYESVGVQECAIWQLYEQRIDWWALRDGRYEPLEPDANGVIASRVFPGLRLDVAALLAGDLATVLAAVR